MLYGEIDRLSAAWSTLDEQNSSKVFNLVNLEEKVQRLNTDVRPPRPPSRRVELTRYPIPRKRRPTIDTLRRFDRRTPSLLRTQS
jgi:hypothetical protein